MKNNRKSVYSLIAILIVFAVILTAVVQDGKNDAMKIVFLDIGQGDSILISQGSQQLLIDGGRDGKLLLEKLGKYVPFWDRNIETVIETHPDADHIGGLVSVLGAYSVESVLETKMQSTSQTFKKLEEEIQGNNVEKIEAKKDVTIKFASGASVEVLYPFESVVDVNGKDTNMYSVVVKLTTGKSEFLFTGDLPIQQEKEIMGRNIDVKSDVLKVGHHGSKYSTSNEFLDVVKPSDAVISVGKNNTYGHPNQEVLQRLVSHGINVYRTDEVGDIIYECTNMSSLCKIK